MRNVKTPKRQNVETPTRRNDEASANRTGAATRRPGGRAFVMVLVVGFAALAMTATTAYLALNSHAYPMALNQKASARAQHLAGSGVALATHYLSVPPTTVNVGNYWTGVSNFSMDGSADTVDVTVTQSAAATENYIVSATGTARDSDGSVRGKATVTTELVTPPPFTWSLSRVLTASGSISIPANITISGNVHDNGSLTCASPVTGAITATGAIAYTGGGTPTRTPNTTAVTMPTLNAAQWSRYVVNGVVRAAQDYSSKNLTGTDVAAVGGKSGLTVVNSGGGVVVVVDASAALTGGAAGLGKTVNVVTSAVGLTGTAYAAPSAVTANNPGGVLVSTGNVDVPSGATGLIGTLVVNGNLSVKAGSAPTFFAMPGYPALVVTGDITIDNMEQVEINGPVLLGGQFTGTKGGLTMNGPVLAYGTGFKGDFASGINLTTRLVGVDAKFTWKSDFQSLYDFSSTSVQPITLLSWSE